MIKKIIALSLILFGLAFAGGYPTIQSFEYDLQYRKGTTEFVDFNYELIIQGATKEYTMTLEVTLYNINDEIVKVFRKIVTIGVGDHVVKNTKMIRAQTANSFERVGVELKLLKGKY